MSIDNANASDKITGVYKLIVYESGKIELTKQPIEYIFDDLDLDVPSITTISLEKAYNPSSRMFQILAVVEKVTDEVTAMWKNTPEESRQVLNDNHISRLISKAAIEVAKKENLTLQTIIDKYTRQIDLDASKFSELLMEFYITDYLNDIEKSKLRNTLINYCSKNIKNEDASYIDHKLREFAYMLST